MKNETNLNAAILKIVKQSVPVRKEISKHTHNLLSLEKEISKLEKLLDTNEKTITSLQNKLTSYKSITGSMLQNHFTRIKFLKSENTLFSNKILEIKKEKTELEKKIKFLSKKISEFSVKEEKMQEIINFNKKKMQELKDDLLSEEISELMFYNKLKS